MYAASVDEIRAAFETYLREQAERITQQGIAVTTAVLDGPPSRELLSAVAAGDLVVMTSHGRSGLKRWLLGSVAEKMVRRATVPVLIAR
jgi:nucleotide-binding universal stress UspA family protein